MLRDETQAKPGSPSPEQIGETRQAHVLLLNRAVYAEVCAHAEQSYPDECCGVLLGHPIPQGWRVVAAVRAANARVDAPRSRYEIAPAELVRIERKARGLNLEIAGFYHSHPDHPAHWSPADLAEAHWLGCYYLISTVDQGKATVTSSFLLAGATEEDKRFEPQLIQIDDELAGPACI
jgi:proteasome lid subunit RPN8/RPN11